MGDLFAGRFHHTVWDVRAYHRMDARDGRSGSRHERTDVDEVTDAVRVSIRGLGDRDAADGVTDERKFGETSMVSIVKHGGHTVVESDGSQVAWAIASTGRSTAMVRCLSNGMSRDQQAEGKMPP